jgi:hypothetical protein
MNKTAQQKKAMIEALTKSLGIVTHACGDVKISRSTYYMWLREDKDFAAEVADIDDIAVDFAESKLHELISNGETAAVIFYMKTKGKKRGYVERQELAHSGSMNIINLGTGEADNKTE